MLCYASLQRDNNQLWEVYDQRLPQYLIRKVHLVWKLLEKKTKGEHTQSLLVFIVQYSEQAAVRVPVMPISGTLLFRPREAFLLTSAEPAH